MPGDANPSLSQDSSNLNKPAPPIQANKQSSAMTLHGMGSSTGTDPDHQNSANRSKRSNERREGDKASPGSKASANRKAKVEGSAKSYSVGGDACGSPPSRSRSRNIESLLNTSGSTSGSLRNNDKPPSRKPTAHKSKRKGKSESGLKVSKMENVPRSPKTNKKSGKSDSRKTVNATVAPPPKNGLMLFSQKLGQSSGSNMPGLNRLPVNGRVFGCVFFVGKTPNPEEGKTGKEVKRVAHKQSPKKLKEQAKARNERKSRTKKVQEKRTKNPREKKSEVRERYPRVSEKGTLMETVKAHTKQTDQDAGGNNSLKVKKDLPSRGEKRDSKKDKRSDRKKHHSSQDRTLCRVEIAGKEKDKIPTLVVKVCAKQ